MNGAMGESSALVQLAPFALILVVFYFLLIRPQQQKAKETQRMLDALKVGDAVVTTGGLHGRIVRLNDSEVTIEAATKVQLRFERSAVSQVKRSTKAEEKS